MYDITPDIADALKDYIDFKHSGVSDIDAFLAQQDMFANRPSLTASIMREFFAKKASQQQIADTLREYAKLAMLQDNYTPALFEIAVAPRERLWELAVNKATGERYSIEAKASSIPSAEEVAEAKRQYDEVVARYTNPDGTKKPGWMKAPNGKPTKLTEEQWVWVRTPNFKKWFGDWEKAAEVYTIVDVQNAPFSNVSAAIEWVKGNGVIGVMTNEETDGKGEINVSVGSIREMLNPRQREKSVSAAAHFAALTKLREIIRESKVVESHPDYKKGADGKRSKENGINPDVQIEVLYGAIHFGDDVYRVKTRIKRYSQPSEPLKAYSYQVSEIEVLSGTLEEAKSHTLPTDKTSITGNSLLQGVLNVNGNLILEHSKVVDENGEPLVVYRGDDDMASREYESGMFVSRNKDEASGYGEVYDLFVNARKIFDGSKDFDAIGDEIEENFETIKEELRSEVDEWQMEESYENWDDFVDAIKSNDWVAVARRQYDEVVARYTNPDGTKKPGWMKAPNGKPTKLTEAQWVWVRTPNFKKWFGDWEGAQLLDLAEKAWDNKNFIDKFVFTPSDGLSQKLSGLLGHPVSQIVITADAVRHMKKHHGDSKTETPRGQIAMTAEDALLIPYILNNFDDAVRVPASDMKHGEKAVEIRKRINGIAIVATIEHGKNKQFVVSGWKKMSAASMLRNASPKLNVRSAADIQMVQQEIAEVKRSAKNSSKVVDENGEPLVVWHGSRWNPLAEAPGDAVFGKSKTPSQGTYLTDRQGFFFANESVAEDYQGGSLGTLTAYFINARNPYVVDVREELRELDYDIETEREEAEAAGYPIGRWLGEGNVSFEANDSATAYLDDNMHEIMDRADESKSDAVLVRGADGSFVTVAFSPTQIKSATDNIGTYSQRSDIRWSIVSIGGRDVAVATDVAAMENINAKDPRSVEKYINAHLESDIDMLVGGAASITGKSARHFAWSRVRELGGRQMRQARVKAATVIRDLIGMFTADDSTYENKPTKDGVAWRCRLAFGIPKLNQQRKVVGGVVYDADVVIKDDGHGKYFYDVSNLEKNETLTQQLDDQAEALIGAETTARLADGAGSASGVSMFQIIPQNGYGAQRFSITAEEDRAYLDAVRRGDMETAQRMVRESATRAGYTIEEWHGDRYDSTYTVYDESKTDYHGFWVWTDAEDKRLEEYSENFPRGQALSLSQINGHTLSINSVRNVFPKDTAEWLHWIEQGKLLYADKEKVQAVIDQQRINLADVDYLNLDKIETILDSFTNPQVSNIVPQSAPTVNGRNCETFYSLMNAI